MSKSKEVVKKYEKIADRMNELGLGADKHELVIMISAADDKFKLKLDEMLNAPYETFNHEMSDMLSFYNSLTCMFDDDRYVSRFACDEIQKENEMVTILMKRKYAKDVVTLLNRYADLIEYFTDQMHWSKLTRKYARDCKKYASMIAMDIENKVI